MNDRELTNTAFDVHDVIADIKAETGISWEQAAKTVEIAAQVQICSMLSGIKNELSAIDNGIDDLYCK